MPPSRSSVPSRRSTLGTNPLDALDGAQGGGAAPAAPTAPEPASETARAAESAQNERVTFILPSALIREIRSAAVALSGPPLRLTLARLATDALRAELKRLEEEHNKGKPFPDFAGKLVGGRPIGSTRPKK